MAKRGRDEDDDDYIEENAEDDDEEEEPRIRPTTRANTSQKQGNTGSARVRDEDEEHEEEGDDDEDEEEGDDDEDDEEDEEYENTDDEESEEPLTSTAKKRGKKPVTRRRAQDDGGAPPLPKRQKRDTDSVRPTPQPKKRRAFEQKALDDRKAKRADPEHKSAVLAKRLEAAPDRDESVTTYLSEDLTDLLRQRSAYQEILDQYSSKPDEPEIREILRSIFDLSCHFDKVQRAPRVHGFWSVFDQLSLPTLRFLLALARGLTVIDVESAFQTGVLEYSPPDDPTPVAGSLTYIRIAQARNGIDAVFDYLRSSPADAAYCFVRLAELGASPEDIATTFYKTFDALGHRAAIEELWPCLDDLQRPSLVPDNRLSTYGGTTVEKQPSGRLQDDVDAAAKKQLPTRLGRWLGANNSQVKWGCYRIVELCLPQSSGICTDPVAATSEQFVVAMQVGRCLNSYVGGYIRLFDPPPELSAVLAKVPAPVYGHRRIPASDVVRAYYVAERSFLRSRICDESFRVAVRNVASVARSNGDTVPYIRIMKDLTEEALGANRSFWEKDAGKGPKLIRHLLGLLNPQIGAQGDLSDGEITAHVGPTIDWYRLVPGTSNFWHHTLGTSTLLVALKPVIIAAYSNCVFTAIAEGDLRHVWRSFPEAVANQVLSGQLPVDVARYLPSTHGDPYWHPESGENAYIEAIGKLFVGRYGADDHNLALVIPNLHPGVSKYRARESILVETIMTLVCAIENVAVAQVQQLHDAGVVVPRDDPGRLRKYLEELRDAIEAQLAGIGLRTHLDEAKAAYRLRTDVARHLEQTQRPAEQPNSRLPSAEPFEIPYVTHASASGAARVAQYEFLIGHFDELIANGLSARAFAQIPSQFRDDFKTDGFRNWVMNVKPGVRFTNPARVYGNTPQAQANASRAHQALANNKAAQSAGGRKTVEKSKAKKDHLAIPTNMLRHMLENIGDLIKQPPHMQKEGGVLALAETNRWCFCPQCSAVILACEENHKHTCGGNTIAVIPSNFPTLTRILYPHDIIDNPALQPHVPPFDDILDEITIESIFASPANRNLANGAFTALDLLCDPLPFSSFTGSIWVAKDSADREENARLHVAMALDRCAASLSQCPADLFPVTAEHHAKAWGKDILKPARGELPYSVVKCSWGYFGLLVPHTGPYFDHACAGTIHRRPINPANNTRIMGSRTKGGDRDCGTQRFHETFDLPPEFIRRLVYRELIVPEQTLRIPGKRGGTGE
ncbi:hypothetical protein C8R45DRAFT_38897 [Mycena sanguinolenta]|nr:hypothetical protein C8R45DRAFT_38897 [Mycena sanguinolenta]